MTNRTHAGLLAGSTLLTIGFLVGCMDDGRILGDAPGDAGRQSIPGASGGSATGGLGVARGGNSTNSGGLAGTTAGGTVSFGGAIVAIGGSQSPTGGAAAGGIAAGGRNTGGAGTGGNDTAGTSAGGSATGGVTTGGVGTGGNSTGGTSTGGASPGGGTGTGGTNTAGTNSTGGSAGSGGGGSYVVTCGNGTLNEALNAYCTGLGYQVVAVMGSGLCSFPDGNTCEITQFFRGTCRLALSYCARHGYTVVTGTCAQGQVVACQFTDGSVCWDGDFATGACGPCVPGRDAGCAGVWVSTDQAVYTNDEAMNLTLHNDTTESVFVPPCAGQGVEQLLSNGSWELVPMESMCDPTSGSWQVVAPNGTRPEPIGLPSPVHAIYRVFKTVGYGCDTSVSSDLAQCERVTKVYSEPFAHLVK